MSVKIDSSDENKA